MLIYTFYITIYILIKILNLINILLIYYLAIFYSFHNLTIKQ